jgi:catechol 2,3-dioxygenase-like lactoylglutathione lyase family enzyme
MENVATSTAFCVVRDRRLLGSTGCGACPAAKSRRAAYLAHSEHAYDAEMPVRFVAVSFDALDPEALGVFWAGVLGREIVEEADGVLLPGNDTQVGLQFSAATTAASGRNRLHLHLTSSTAEDQRRTVETVLRLGGHRFGTRPLPMGRDIFLADPGGNEFCVIEPGNNYLTGCGLLGEFTCDGTREVGLFWRDALGWPLVWNQGEQTAIQSPRGGTKISWDSWPAAPKNGRNRQRFHVAAPEPAVEADRLAAIGATVLGDRDNGVELADPDGNRFSITVGLHM